MIDFIDMNHAEPLPIIVAFICRKFGFETNETDGALFMLAVVVFALTHAKVIP